MLWASTGTLSTRSGGSGPLRPPRASALPGRARSAGALGPGARPGAQSHRALSAGEGRRLAQDGQHGLGELLEDLRFLVLAEPLGGDSVHGGGRLTAVMGGRAPAVGEQSEGVGRGPAQQIALAEAPYRLLEQRLDTGRGVVGAIAEAARHGRGAQRRPIDVAQIWQSGSAYAFEFFQELIVCGQI
ncbi:hypothetical protein [Streptomyces rhizosphaericus]|uniref:hypothetical protein n=1 Tax=Streptomyces rhizosphaericus TaxID=114699 RepID=UPI003632244C